MKGLPLKLIDCLFTLSSDHPRILLCTHLLNVCNMQISYHHNDLRYFVFSLCVCVCFWGPDVTFLLLQAASQKRRRGHRFSSKIATVRLFGCPLSLSGVFFHPPCHKIERNPSIATLPQLNTKFEKGSSSIRLAWYLGIHSMSK